jgi:tetratricopeptide (TPR) repeat protein
MMGVFVFLPLNLSPNLGLFCILSGVMSQGEIADLERQIELHPGEGGAYLQLAHALQRQGNLQAAADCLQKCLSRLPGFAEAHYNLGNVCVALGRIHEASTHFRRAAELRPDFAEALNNLANALLTLCEADRAIEHLKTAIKLRPNYLEAHYTLGNAFWQRHRVADAIHSFQRALELKPDYPPAHIGLGEAFLETGDLGQAESCFRRAVGPHPFLFMALLNLAANNFYTANDPSIDRLKHWLADPRLSSEAAGQLRFTLGYLLSQAGSGDEAFEHFRQGNAICRARFLQSGKAFDPMEHSRFVDRIMTVFSNEYFERRQSHGLETELPIFIVGMPRSGTTLVEQILSHHPIVFGAGEIGDLSRLVKELPARLRTAARFPESVLEMDDARLCEFGEDYVNGLKAYAAAQSSAGEIVRITDKMLENYLYLGLAAAFFPRARIIHCRRDPRDVCVSCFFTFFGGLNFTWDLGDLGSYYRDHDRLMAYWRSVVPVPIFEVVYEELVENQETVTRRLLEFCGLPWDERCLKFHENRCPVQTMSKLQVRQPIFASSVGRWRRYAAHLGPFLEALGQKDHFDAEDNKR